MQTAVSPIFWRQKAYVATSLTHFFVDVLNSGRTLLVAIIAVAIGLSNAQVGFFLLLYNVSSALSQPFFGWLADRFGPRWPIVGGMGWMILFYSLAAMTGDWPALIAITIAGFGSGAFHPAGAMVASQISQEQRARATAIFFMAGQIGLFVGPVLAGFALGLFDRPGYLALPLLSLLAFGGGWRWMRNDQPVTAVPLAPRLPEQEKGLPLVETSSRKQPRRQTAILLAAIVVLLNTASIGTINLVPKLFTEWGLPPAYVGWTAGLLMLGSAMGGVFGGAMADRLGGGRWPIFLGCMGAIVPLYAYIPAADPWRFLLLLLAGFFMGMPHSILVLEAQGLMPGRRALASGLILGFMFFGGAVGTYLAGLLADQIGLAPTLQYLAALPFTAGAISLLKKG
jgi:FSR family fosmidomycin resistance protein-like MFS transporter